MTAPDSGGQHRTAVVSIGAALVLVGLKLGTGLAVGSLALASAGIESLGDVFAAVLTLLAVRWAVKPADADHPYGHRRAENLSALGEAAIVTGGAIVIVVEAARRLGGGGEAPEASAALFAVIGVAIVIDVSRIVISLRTARRYGSAALRSNAFNFAGDLAGSLSVLVGLGLVRAGFEQGDALAALLVAGIILAAAARLVLDNASLLMDRAPSDAEARARDAIAGLGELVQLRRLRVRDSGGRAFADAVVAVSPAAAVIEGHAAADRVEEAVRAALPGSDVVVHVEPRRRDLDLRDHVLAAALAEPLVREAHDVSLYRRDGRTTVSLHLKFAPEVDLADAHAVAERVEGVIAARPGVDEVLSHLEPLEQPVGLGSAPTDGTAALERAVRRLAARGAAGAVRRVRVLPCDDGVVVFVTLGVADGIDLVEAHRTAGALEEALRREQPGIADVVVHTEPG